MIHLIKKVVHVELSSLFKKEREREKATKTLMVIFLEHQFF
jgi:hypothetical protein